MRSVIAVQVADLALADLECKLAAPSGAGLDARPGRDLLRDLFAGCLGLGHECLPHSDTGSLLRLQVQVNLKSRPICDSIPYVAQLLTISEVSKRSGVAASALRFYEDRGLITSHRAGSGHRRYDRSVLRRVAFIVFAQRVGLTLEEIGAELEKLPL